MSKSDEMCMKYLAYLDSHLEDDVKLMPFGEWMRAQVSIRECQEESCGGTIVTSTDRCSLCSTPWPGMTREEAAHKYIVSQRDLVLIDGEWTIDGMPAQEWHDAVYEL